MQRKRRKKKRFGVFLFLLVVCIGIGIMFVPWAMQPENFREVKNKINGFLYKEDFPDSYNAKSLILVDCSDDEIFVSKNENEPQIPASLQFQNIYGVNLQTVLYFVIKMENGMQYS